VGLFCVSSEIISLVPKLSCQACSGKKLKEMPSGMFASVILPPMSPVDTFIAWIGITKQNDTYFSNPHCFLKNKIRKLTGKQMANHFTWHKFRGTKNSKKFWAYPHHRLRINIRFVILKAKSLNLQPFRLS